LGSWRFVSWSNPSRIPAEGKDSAASVAIFELDVPAGAKVPIAHSHDAYEETIYGIEGVITFTLEGRKIEIGPADHGLTPAP
jgi:quercetin dioxygenase-like cupin family protein